MRRILIYRVSALILFIGLAWADEKESCKMAGAIFGVDPLGGTLMLKDATGYLKNVQVSSGTVISKLPVTAGGSITPIRSADLNIGDIVCVHGGDGDAPTRLSVVSRIDVHRAQIDFLSGWQRNSLYGSVSSVDVKARSFTVKPLPPSPDDKLVRVSVAPSVQLRTAPPNARRISEAVSFRLEDLMPGEPVYVRGARADNGPEMTASLVLKGGYRGILGTLIEVQILGSIVRIQEFGTGRTLSIKVTSGELYRTTENVTHPMRVETASGVLLAPVGLTDMEAGDAVLIIGKLTNEASEGEGLAVVTKFGTFGVLPQDPQSRLSWVITK